MADLRQRRQQDRAGVFAETGLHTVFHHHCAGFVETPDEIARLLDLTDPGAINLVFDTGHFSYGAGHCDAVAGMERFRDRIRYVHLKDCQPDVASRARAEGWNYFEALGTGCSASSERRGRLPCRAALAEGTGLRGLRPGRTGRAAGDGFSRESAMRTGSTCAHSRRRL